MVGFALNVENPEAMGADAAAYTDRCEPTALDDQNIACVVRDGSGSELWLGLKKTPAGEAELTTLNPAFAGDARVALVIDGDVSPAEWKPFEMRVQAHFAGDEIPLILDLADPREATRFAPGATVNADITAFADEIGLFETEAAYFASQKDHKINLAANHFIPAGMFSADGAAKVPTAHALFAGKILKSALRRNDKGRASYWWFLVETLDGVGLNVVADPAQVKTAPQAGSILAGSFWMSARLAKP